MGRAFDLINQRLDHFWNSLLDNFPDIMVGLILIILGWIVARLVSNGVKRMFERQRKPDLGEVISAITKGAILVFSWLLASAVVFPSVSPGSILSALGFGSVAIGFAFKDILQNLVAGVLVLARRPYGRGDQITVKGFEGTVTAIQSRATMLKTADGRRVIIPNSDAYSSAVVVSTHFPNRRSDFLLNIGYDSDPGAAIDLFITALEHVEGVSKDPEPEVLSNDLTDSAYQILVRWWVDTRKFNVQHVRSTVILALYKAAVEGGVSIPTATTLPTTVILKQPEGETLTVEGSASSDSDYDDYDDGGADLDGEQGAGAPRPPRRSHRGGRPRVSTPKKTQSAEEAKQMEVEQTAVPVEGAGDLSDNATVAVKTEDGKAEQLETVKKEGRLPPPKPAELRRKPKDESED